MDVIVELETLPPEGMHFLQIQNPDGMFSNDLFSTSPTKKRLTLLTQVLSRPKTISIC